ncbi:MAG TPA: efflux RND transporter periplasmic adaptor subunit [Candidatus Acidoferrum sp.]|nr:efflux RND transporter periplasmic adaptor subunit [Candidatus Acidoferrum sp.]
MHDPLQLQTTAAPRGLKRTGIVVAVIAGLIVIAGITVRNEESANAQLWSDAQATPTVQLVRPSPAEKTQILTFPGTLAAWNSARIFARVSGYISSWYSDIGAQVAKGAELGAIDTPELDQQIIEARAALGRAKAEAALARSTATRWSDLLESTSVSQQEADEKNAAATTREAVVHEAEAVLGRLEATKSYSVIRAPFAGVVTARNTDIGDLVGPGASSQQPMFSISDEQQIRIYVNVPQQYASLMQPGLTAKLSVPEWPGRVFPARLVAASGAINSQTGALQVQLVTPNTDRALHSGGYAQVQFELPGSTQAMNIPASSLILRGTGTTVATLGADGHVHMVPVTVGRDLGPKVEIITGLTRDIQLIDNPPDSLADGAEVKVANDRK